MTTHKNMPERIVQKPNGDFYPFDERIHDSSSYTRSDIHESVKAERDAYMAMCETLAIALVNAEPVVWDACSHYASSGVSETLDDALNSYHAPLHEALTAYAKLKEGM